jgi:hypothetical protein
VKIGSTPGWATRIRSAAMPSTSVASRPVYAELTKTTSQRFAASYCARCIERVRRVVHSGNRTGTRSCSIVDRTPERCGGVIHCWKWSASKRPSSRSAGGRPKRLHAVRQACANGSRHVRSSTSTAASARAISSRPAGLVGAKATTSCRPAAASTTPASEPRM